MPGLDKDITELVGHLDGFVRAITSVDRLYGDVLGSAFAGEYNEDSPSKSLMQIYGNFSNLDDYAFDAIFEVKEKELQPILEKHILQSPFTSSHQGHGEAVNQARFNSVFKMIELVRIIRGDEYETAKIYCCPIFWKSQEMRYDGYVFVFPFGGRAVFLQILRKEQ